MNKNRSPVTLYLNGDFCIQYITGETTTGEKAYMLYVFIPGPVCKMFFLFVNKMVITPIAIWSDNSIPNSPTESIEHLRNINAESSIQRELVNFAKHFQSNLRGIELLKLGQPK
jgi:hypothetical protein